MARTVQEIRVPRGLDEVRNVVSGWLNSNSFKVLEWQATGTTISHSYMTTRWKITPRPGCIVAIQPTGMSNGVVIEVTLVPEGGGTLVHAEFYVPPAGSLVVVGGEMDVTEDAVNAMVPRRRGFKLMQSFMQTLGQLGGGPPMAVGAPQPMPPQAPGVGQMPTPYAGGPPPPQPMYQQPAPQPMYQQPAPQPMYQQPAPQPMYQQPAPQPMHQQPAPQPMHQQQAPQQPPQYTPQPAAQSTQALPPSTMQSPASMPQPQPTQASSQMPQPKVGPQPQQAAPPQVFYCMYCGTQLSSAARFCVRCGKQTVPPD